MGLTEPVSRWEHRPVWNGKAETWDDRDREVTLRTDSFDPRQAPTLGPRLVRGLRRFPQVYDRLLGSGGAAREEHWRRSGLVRKVRSETARNAHMNEGREPLQRVSLHTESDSTSVTENWARR